MLAISRPTLINVTQCLNFQVHHDFEWLCLHLDLTTVSMFLEVERAAKLLRDIASGKTITQVDTVEDTIVFAGITHEEFVRTL